MRLNYTFQNLFVARCGPPVGTRNTSEWVETFSRGIFMTVKPSASKRRTAWLSTSYGAARNRWTVRSLCRYLVIWHSLGFELHQAWYTPAYADRAQVKTNALAKNCTGVSNKLSRHSTTSVSCCCQMHCCQYCSHVSMWAKPLFCLTEKIFVNGERFWLSLIFIITEDLRGYQTHPNARAPHCCRANTARNNTVSQTSVGSRIFQ